MTPDPSPKRFEFIYGLALPDGTLRVLSLYWKGGSTRAQACVCGCRTPHEPANAPHQHTQTRNTPDPRGAYAALAAPSNREPHFSSTRRRASGLAFTTPGNSFRHVHGRHAFTMTRDVV